MANLPELSTKQSVENIRYLSKDGNITYYQLRSGVLSVTTSYNNKVIFEKKSGTQYHVTASHEMKKTLIEVIDKFHGDYNILKNSEIFLGDYGETKTISIGRGITPRFHLNGAWISYYDIENRKIYIKNSTALTKSFTIDVANKTNPFFQPSVVVLNPEVFLFTDINSQGVMGIMKYMTAEQKIYPLVKSPQNGIRLEMCKKNNALFVGQFSYPTLKRGSSIYKLTVDSSGMSTARDDLYSSSLEDIGNIACDVSGNQIYFVKMLDASKKYATEAAGLDFNTKKVTIMSDLKFVSQIVTMDSRAFVPFRDKFYILNGEDEKKKPAKN
ncbi:MAG: hypothetical protein JNM93_01250 [Bacteriovoracaceae bacterium]|nr:hypothetical protein [Bacteriovoracaceae bacterium]